MKQASLIVTMLASRPLTAIAALLAVASFARLISYGLDPGAELIDFSHYWLAGHMWDAGQDPYGDSFRAEALRLFGPGDPQPPLLWAYTPNWFAPAWLIAQVPVRTAGLAWTAVNAVMLLGGAALLHDASRRLGRPISTSATLLVIAFASAMTGATACVGTGNCSLLLFGGACSIIWGHAAGSRGAVAAGLVLLLLKPNLGIPLVAAVALLPGGMRPAIWSVAISAVLAAPALLVASPVAMIEGLAANLAYYETFQVNSPEQQTGVATLLWALGGPVIPGLALIVPAALSAVALTWIGTRSVDPADRGRRLHIAMFALIASAVFINRLHIYDLVLLVPLLFFAGGAGVAVMGFLAAGVVFIFRPENMATVLGMIVGHEPLPAILASLGCLMFYLAAVLICWRTPGAGWAR